MFGRLILLVLISAVPARAEDQRAVEFFEKKVRPLLVAQCLECHGADAKKIKGGLRLTSRAEMLKGGESGPAAVPGDPSKSRLIHAVRYAADNLKMPPKGRLKDGDIADLETWVKSGAIWPDAGTTIAKSIPGQLFSDEQKQFWAFQPMHDRPLPNVRDSDWPRSPIDAFILAKLEEKRLRPAKPANRYALLRRVTFDLTGLPPTPDEIDSFVRDASPNAFEKLIDRLLESPRYGERWGRHWLDIVRYADSNGLDENTAFGNAWRYRDYVIRSFNSDKPYDVFLREQIAGDLLPDAHQYPDRLTGTGFLVLGPKVLAEPDKQKMKMDIADEQIDTLGKAVLGLTFGCARCHDHKFDPIPQRDYYSLLSIFTSTRTMKNLATVAQAFERALPTGEKREVVEARAKKIETKQAELRRITEELRTKVLSDARSNVGAYLLAAADAKGRSGVARMTGKVAGAIVLEAEKYKKGTADKADTGYGEGIGIILSYKAENTRAEYTINVTKSGEYDLELRYAALESRPVRISVEGKVVLPQAAKGTTGGWNPEHQAWKPEGRLRLQEGTNTLAIEAHGLLPHIDKLAVLPLEVTPAIASGQRPSAGTPAEVSHQRKLILEFVNGWAEFLRQVKLDDPLFGPWRAVADLADASFEKDAAALLAKFGDTAPAGLVDGPAPKTLGEFAARYAAVLPQSETGKKLLTDAAGPFALTTPLPANPELFYPTELAKLSQANGELVAIQKTAPTPVMVLSVEEGAKYPEVKADGKPRNLLVQVRGNYLTAGEEAPPVFPRILAGENARPFTTCSDDTPKPETNQTRYGSSRPTSGRLELANWITNPKHPLTARVVVNRVWQHHFGEGLVRSPDNFGKLGERPTHPELLDYLALRFIEGGWSIKKLHKMILLSAVYQQSTQSSALSPQSSVDPENRLLSRMNRRRLEAEPIRDSLMAVAGTLDPKMGGTFLNNGNFTYVNNENSTNTARYDNHRRSVYLPVVRNTVFDFFQVFDFAEPHVSNGKRASTVIAPQALFLMNSPFVKEQAQAFADGLLRESGDDANRVRHAYLKAYGRPATGDEVEQALEYLSNYEAALSGSEMDVSKRRPRAWLSFCQVLFASSEFVFVE